VLDFINRDAVSGKYKPVIRKVPVPEQFQTKELDLTNGKRESLAAKQFPAQIVYTGK
jgi:hypothetical protein